MKLFWLIPALIFFADIAGAQQVVEAKISGMVCPMCAYNIEKSFKAEIKDKTIADFDVDLDDKLVTFKISEGKALSDDQIESGIRDAGYLLISIERKDAQ